ncbi:MAG: hypothetical protein AAF367_20760 [Pseudomonadota bacterium]
MKLKTTAWVVVADDQNQLGLEGRGAPGLIDPRIRSMDEIERLIVPT